MDLSMRMLLLAVATSLLLLAPCGAVRSETEDDPLYLDLFLLNALDDIDAYMILLREVGPNSESSDLLRRRVRKKIEAFIRWSPEAKRESTTEIICESHSSLLKELQEMYNCLAIKKLCVKARTMERMCAAFAK